MALISALVRMRVAGSRLEPAKTSHPSRRLAAPKLVYFLGARAAFERCHAKPRILTTTKPVHLSKSTPLRITASYAWYTVSQCCQPEIRS